MIRRAARTALLVAASFVLVRCGEPSDGDGSGGSPDSGIGGTGGRPGNDAAPGGAGGKAGSQGTGGSAGVNGTGGTGTTGGSGGVAGSGAAGSGASAGAGAGTAGNAGAGGSIDGGTGGAKDAGGKAGASGGVADGSATGGSGGQGGSAGQAGSKDGGGQACPTALVGWATIAGDGVAATTGGGNTAPVRPTTVADLTRYASDATPRVIEIAGTFDVPNLGIASNKTLVGTGNNATINGGLQIRGTDTAPVSNVILRNLRVNGAQTAVEYDAVQIYFAHHVWIDHCEIWDGPDGNLDMTHAVNWITVSFTKFRYTTAYQRPPGETSDHRFSSLLGNSDDNDAEDAGRIKVTFHHNWWAERVIERMPRVRFGQVHVFNNYFSSAGNDHCVRAGRAARLLIEGNYFDGVQSPHEFNSTADEATASITARSNTYVGTTGNQSSGGGGTPLTSVPYAATIEPASGVPALVQACAGPRP